MFSISRKQCHFSLINQDKLLSIYYHYVFLSLQNPSFPANLKLPIPRLNSSFEYWYLLFRAVSSLCACEQSLALCV